MIKDEKFIIKESPLPLYYQLKELIKSQIEKGEFKPGELVLSERELVEKYEISRPTVRQAINELVIEGLLTREKGRGTFVAAPKISQWFLESVTSFSEEMMKKGLEFSTKLISIEKIAATSTLRNIFGNDSDQFFRLERLRYVKAKPVVLVTTFLPLKLFPNLEKENLELNSLYSIIQKKYGYRLESVTRTLEANTITDEDAQLLEMTPMAAIQLIRTTGYMENQTPFEYSLARYRGDLSSFTVTLKFDLGER